MLTSPAPGTGCARRALAGLLMAVACHVCAMHARADDKFGAIAYSQSTGRYGYAWGKSSQSEADAAALSECKASDAFVAVYGKNTWIALAAGNGTAYGWGWSNDGKQDAMNRALTESAKHGARSRVLSAFYAGGEGQAKVVFKTPANTRVTVDDQAVEMSNGVGELMTPSLLGGKRYVYTVKARMTVGTETFDEEVTAHLYAFSTTRVRFPRLEEIAERPPRAKDLPSLPESYFPTVEP